MAKPQKHTQRILAYVLLAAACALAAAYLYGGIQRNVHRIERAEKTSQAALFSSCIRLNIVRASDNLSHYADYKFFKLTTKLIDHPATRLNSAQKQQTRFYRAALRSTSNQKTWIPLTNCEAAVDNPVAFKIPYAISFSKRLPPANDLNVAKQQRSLALLLHNVKR